jgi:hypothetical protein
MVKKKMPNRTRYKIKGKIVRDVMYQIGTQAWIHYPGVYQIMIQQKRICTPIKDQINKDLKWTKKT